MDLCYKQSKKSRNIQSVSFAIFWPFIFSAGHVTSLSYVSCVHGGVELNVN